MIKTLDFNGFVAGTIMRTQVEGVTISAVGGSGDAMIFDTSAPTGGDSDLATDNLGGVLIVSEDGDRCDPDDNAGGGTLVFEFDGAVKIKSLTFLDIEETARMNFYDADGNIISQHFVEATGDNGQVEISLYVLDVARMEVVLKGSGAIDNLVYDDANGVIVTGDGIVTGSDGDDLIDLGYDGDAEGDRVDAGDALIAGEGPDDDIIDAGPGNDKVAAFVGDDEIYAGSGDDVVDGGVGNDIIYGDSNLADGAFGDGVTAGNDYLNGGDGDDVIFGEGGSDTLIGGAGADQISGGDDADLIIGGTGGDAVDGGAGGIDNDTLDLSGSGPLRVLSQTVDADGNSTSGIIGFLDVDGNVADTMTFTEIENLILPENRAPVAVDDTATMDEDDTATVDVLANDSDPDGDPLTVISATSPDGAVTINADGSLDFEPNPDFNGNAVITYTIDDGNGGTDTAQVTVEVAPINDAPQARDDRAETAFDTPVTVAVLANDIDVDGDPLAVTSATSADGDVTINADGTITFTPTPGFSGGARIDYTIQDPDGLTSGASVLVTVAADTRDGIVDGTAGNDLIDIAYDGDPDGDRVDAGDAILPGEEGDDDIIRAGDGDDTVLAGNGNDEVDGGAGDDSIEGGAGDDELLGGDGNDTILGGDGNDFIDASGGDLAPDLGYPSASTDPLAFDPDSDPENDRDFVDGGAGDDTIITGDDRDTIFGGAGNDVIDAGIDDDVVYGGDGGDRIVGGEGNDLIRGGDGNDTIYAGNDPDLGLDILDIPDEPTAGNPFAPDREPGNGRDTVYGGAGDDVIYGADDDDLLIGGSGNDFIDGQIDDDTLEGGTGDDTLVGGQGNDSLSGGLGADDLHGGDGNDTLRGNRDDDVLNGGAGDDLLDGGGQNDLLFGGDGNDTLMGATGDDTLSGGTGDDLIMGGAGNDLIEGNEGNDDMRGGADRDTFRNVNAGDVVDGNETGDDYDTLDLGGSAPEGGRLEVVYDPDNAENGTVFYFDEDNNPAGELVFSNIENVIPCFTPGTKIATPKGERLVETLQVGDRVITRDNGIQTIRWVGARDMTGTEFAQAQHLRPVLIRQGALGNDLPERDMMVSPNHRILIANDKTSLYFEESEVLVAAKHLTGLDGVDIVEVSNTTYIHIMFDQHEVILSDGTWTESFQPGDNSLAGIGDAQRDEILELFPELATREGIDAYAAARRSLKKHEARLITE